jgi:hypothetical protein
VNARPLHTLGALLLAVLLLPGQQGGGAQQPSGDEPARGGGRDDLRSSAALQRAWLREVMDLDPAAAAADYARIAADNRPGNLARWVAAARLRELQRIDVAHGQEPDLGDAPNELRVHFEENDSSLDMQALLRRLTGEPGEVLAALATEEGRLPPLRPLVPTAEAWVLDQIGPAGASLLDRRRQRRTSYGPRAPFNDLRNAFSVLRAELDGRPEADAALRAIYFARWQPPRVDGDAEQYLQRFRQNIAALTKGSEWTREWRDLHERLREEVERRAAQDPADAVAFLRRLPYYAERLLTPAQPGGR